MTSGALTSDTFKGAVTYRHFRRPLSSRHLDQKRLLAPGSHRHTAILSLNDVAIIRPPALPRTGEVLA
ncbi:Hypothetical predicted protein, partial [Pelobates cultripes]